MGRPLADIHESMSVAARIDLPYACYHNSGLRLLLSKFHPENKIFYCRLSFCIHSFYTHDISSPFCICASTIIQSTWCLCVSVLHFIPFISYKQVMLVGDVAVLVCSAYLPQVPKSHYFLLVVPSTLPDATLELSAVICSLSFKTTQRKKKRKNRLPTSGI